MQLAVTADLHWGLSAEGDAATRELARCVEKLSPDVFAIAGDVGEGSDFGRGLSLFGTLSCGRLVIPGNHDLWTRDPDQSSLALYEERLANIAAKHGFQYLDLQPYLSPNGSEAVVGSINWYDYSFADPELEQEYPDAQWMYERKLFPTGRHNDGRFIHFGMSDSE
ncbi:MAG TPA: metallophosphoesterase, partial [Armatimonadota bacterium]|nr:metallophosphoesterase [Armatimonadota bacterium]